MNGAKPIGIVGYGYVGQAYERLLSSHYGVLIHDPDPKYFTKSVSQEEINQCDLAIVCVPTPMAEDGSCDISAVAETVGWLEVPTVLIKSTVPPGTTRQLAEEFDHSLCFSPEYIGEGKYFVPHWRYPHPTDPRFHDFMIVGEAIKGDGGDEIIDIFSAVLGPSCRFMKTDSTTAELTKYMENAWGAMKVTFCNEFYEIAKALKVDYRELRELFLLDGRTERMHTLVWPDKRGFGGK